MINDDTKELMLSHLQELMADREAYRWPVVLGVSSCLAAASQAVTGSMDTKLKLKWALVWHRVTTNSRPSATSAQPRKQQVNNRSQRRPEPFSEVAQSRVKACEAFNKGQCVNGTAHPTALHVCQYCLHLVNRLCHHTELCCK